RDFATGIPRLSVLAARNPPTRATLMRHGGGHFEEKSDMMKDKLKTPVAALAVASAALALPGIAMAASATSYTDLNLRAGPGPQYAVIGVLHPDTPVVVEGCIEGGSWCQVAFGDQQGWAYSRYIAVETGGSQ